MPFQPVEPGRRRFLREFVVELLGAEGMEHNRFSQALVFSPASGIYGGADEIQRNVIAERTLGMPREPDPNKGRPYGDVLRSLGR